MYNETKIETDFFATERMGMKGRKNGKNGYCEIYYERQRLKNLFQNKKYLIQRYRALHSEDTEPRKI